MILYWIILIIFGVKIYRTDIYGEIYFENYKFRKLNIKSKINIEKN